MHSFRRNRKSEEHCRTVLTKVQYVTEHIDGEIPFGHVARDRALVASGADLYAGGESFSITTGSARPAAPAWPDSAI